MDIMTRIIVGYLVRKVLQSSRNQELDPVLRGRQRGRRTSLESPGTSPELRQRGAATASGPFRVRRRGLAGVLMISSTYVALRKVYAYLRRSIFISRFEAVYISQGIYME